MWSSPVVFSSRASQVIIPFSAFAGKDLPLSEENNDLSILFVRESTSGHEIEQTPVATGFQAYLHARVQTRHVDQLDVEDVGFLSASYLTAWDSFKFRGRRCSP